jgi:hypothetical protein
MKATKLRFHVKGNKRISCDRVEIEEMSNSRNSENLSTLKYTLLSCIRQVRVFSLLPELAASYSLYLETGRLANPSQIKILQFSLYSL